MDGVEATSRLTAAGIEPPPRVLILTTCDLDEYVFGALRAGVRCEPCLMHCHGRGRWWIQPMAKTRCR
jgi:hypothetical protein